MNSELIEKLIAYKIDKNVKKLTLKTFLNNVISAKLYDQIEGDGIEEKIQTVYDYLNNVVKEPEVKQTLNIVIADDKSSLDYVSYLKQKFDVIVHKVNDVKNPKDIDLVLFTGGEDVNPANYFENTGKYTYSNSIRDEKEINTFQKFRNHSLLLGICRGSQLLTVLSGGRLIQHVEGHDKDHSILLNNRLRYYITSSHHQMLYPFDLNKKDYELIAYSEYFQSKTYLNGNNEEIELSKDFLEPEIVYYKNTNSLCIQGHPEWSHCEKRTSLMCLNLIDKYLKEFKDLKNPQTSSLYTKSYSWDKNLYIENDNDYEEVDHDWSSLETEDEEMPI